YQYNNNIWQKYTVPGDGIANSSQFLSDSQGVFAVVRQDGFTGSSWGYWVVNVFKTDNGSSDWLSYSYGSNNPISTQWIIGDTNSKIAFVDISMGYLISGQYMYRIPYVGDINADFYAGITNQKQDVIKFKQNQNSLMINYNSKEISNIKIISTLGQVIFQQDVNNKNETIVNTQNFKKGTYIVQVNLKDNTHLSVKWIKH
ncbi:MAG: T9SS type A sorting domain-containing protein, partial [Paludibacter sp.]